MLDLSLFKKLSSYIWYTHGIRCVKSVPIWKFSCPYLPACILNREIFRVKFRIQSKCEKMRTRKTSNTNTFIAVLSLTSTITETFFLWILRIKGGDIWDQIRVKISLLYLIRFLRNILSYAEKFQKNFKVKLVNQVLESKL